MSNYHIKINIEINKTEEEMTAGPEKQLDGSFRMVISREEGQSIDQCEQALLSTNFPAIREALSLHLSGVSEEEAGHQWNSSSGFVKKTRQPTQ